jgi:predicted phosphate transport protein (TIGR00153 family)
MLKWFQALMPKADEFFVLFSRHADTLAAGAKALKEMMAEGADIPACGERVSQHEHEADLITAEVLQNVRRSFITPFDRSDVQGLVTSLDDAIDQMHKTAKTVRLYEVAKFEPAMRELAETIVQSAAVTIEAVGLLKKMTSNAVRLNTLTEELTRIEGRSDELYDQGMKALYQTYGATQPMAFIIGAEIYDHLEKVVDRFEDVGNRINSIVLEHL